MQSSSSGKRRDPELHLGGAALVFLLLLAFPVVGVAALQAGAPGALGAACGVGLVALLFGLTGLFQSWAVARGPRSMASGIWIGIAVRVLLYVVVLSALGRIDGLHRPSLAIATGVAFAATLGYEMWVISRTPSLFWVWAADERVGGTDT